MSIVIDNDYNEQNERTIILRQFITQYYEYTIISAIEIIILRRDVLMFQFKAAI